MKTLLTFCLILLGLAGFTATSADAATYRTHERPAYYHHHYRHYHHYHHRRYYYHHHHRMYY